MYRVLSCVDVRGIVLDLECHTVVPGRPSRSVHRRIEESVAKGLGVALLPARIPCLRGYLIFAIAQAYRPILSWSCTHSGVSLHVQVAAFAPVRLLAKREPHHHDFGGSRDHCEHRAAAASLGSRSADHPHDSPNSHQVDVKNNIGEDRRPQRTGKLCYFKIVRFSARFSEGPSAPIPYIRLQHSSKF